MTKNSITSNEHLVQVVEKLVRTLEFDAIIYLTEEVERIKWLNGLELEGKVIAVTSNSDTYEKLVGSEIEAVRLPIHGIDKYRQVPHLLSIALKAERISVGDFILAIIGNDVYPEEGNLLALSEAERDLEELSIKDLLKLTDGIRPAVLDAGIELARRIGLVARRKKQIGTIFTLGDSNEVLQYSEQLIPNPFQGHDETARKITNPDIHDSIVELAKLDGAFVIRGDGLIKTAGTFLGSKSEKSEYEKSKLKLPEGLGTRHVAAAATTARTEATAIVVSSTDGHIRVFSGGEMVLKMDPDIEYGRINSKADK